MEQLDAVKVVTLFSIAALLGPMSYVFSVAHTIHDRLYSVKQKERKKKKKEREQMKEKMKERILGKKEFYRFLLSGVMLFGASFLEWLMAEPFNIFSGKIV